MKGKLLCYLNVIYTAYRRRWICSACININLKLKWSFFFLCFSVKMTRSHLVFFCFKWNELVSKVGTISKHMTHRLFMGSTCILERPFQSFVLSFFLHGEYLLWYISVCEARHRSARKHRLIHCNASDVHSVDCIIYKSISILLYSSPLENWDGKIMCYTCRCT